MSYIRVLAKPIHNELPPLSLYKPKPKDIIAGGDPVRTPVDRLAARVIAPAPDWAKPSPPPATKAERFMNLENRNAPTKTNDELSRSSVGGPGVDRVAQKKEADQHVELADAMAKRFTKNVEDSENLVRRAEEATAAIKYLCEHMPLAYNEYDDQIINALKKTRATKVAIEIETKQTLAALSDIRKFFLDPRHEEEVVKLKEFVDICERLRELKASGFLDAVSDTILRLSI
jgi:hypothetical protein